MLFAPLLLLAHLSLAEQAYTPTGTDATPSTSTNCTPTSFPPRPTHYGVLVYPTYELIDVMGTLEVFTVLSRNATPMALSLISNDTLAPVTNDFSATDPNLPNNHTFGTYVLPQYRLATAPEDIDMLIVPGGIGSLQPYEMTQAYVDFIAARYPRLKYLFVICTGAGLVARTGILDGKQATTNKATFYQVAAMGPKVDWVKHARWVQEGNIWTTSGVSAGIDGAFAIVQYLYGEDMAEWIAQWMEYVRITDPNNDPFAIR